MLLSEIAVAASKFSAGFLAKWFVAYTQSDAPPIAKRDRSGRLQLFDDLRHTENVECSPEIVGKHMQTHLGLNIG